MNAAERIVEIYFQAERSCYTRSDVKIEGGNNRQFDLLAFNPNGPSYHVEISVTHVMRWNAPIVDATRWFEYKFLGRPANKRPDNPNTDFAKKKNYEQRIRDTYLAHGLAWDDIQRVVCLWYINETKGSLDSWLRATESKFNLRAGSVEVLSFRDEVLPRILSSMGTSNYDDDVLRTLSLLLEYSKQTGKPLA